MTYKDIQGWFTWSEIYDRMAAQVSSHGIIIELGTWKGKSLSYLAGKLKQLGKLDVQCFGVDRFDGYGCEDYSRINKIDKEHGETRSLFEQCRDNLDACGFSNVGLVRSDTIEAAELFGDRSIDFLFVDDLHDNDHIEKELVAWLPKLIRPTWIAGDDFAYVMEGVERVLPQVRYEGTCWIAEIK